MSATLRLASASPRRRELLASIGFDESAIEIAPADIDETPRSGETPQAYVTRLARAKAEAGAVGSCRPTLGSDTATFTPRTPPLRRASGAFAKPPSACRWR